MSSRKSKSATKTVKRTTANRPSKKKITVKTLTPKPSLILYYRKYCPYCVEFMKKGGEWEKIKKAGFAKTQAKCVDKDSVYEEATSSDTRTSFTVPMLMVKNGSKRKVYNGNDVSSRSLSKIRKFVKTTM